MYTINAKILDSDSRRPMFGVNIFVSDANGNPVTHNGVPNVGRMSGKDGKFILPVAFEEDFITLSYVGYQPLTLPAASAAKKDSFIMRTIAQDLPAVEINKSRPRTPVRPEREVLMASVPSGSGTKKAWIIAGAVAGVVLIGGIIYYFLKKR